VTVADVAITPVRTIEDVLDDLGGIAGSRVLVVPPIGQATVEDVITVHARTKRLCELVDGTLVEKGMGFRESMIAVALATALRNFVLPRNLGIVTGESGMMRLFAALVRIPDVTFVSWERLPGRKVPSEPVPLLAPDLVVEVLSEGNTVAEMERKRGEYFNAGVTLVWIVDIVKRTIAAYTTVDQPVIFTENQIIEAPGVLPGFALPLRELFSELDRAAGPNPPT
jgi:Uma2 family endonuclease